jgi:hypothetical protein
MPNFPGVYAQVIDRSYTNGLQSRFSCGLVGVATRGPFNSAVLVRNLADFVTNFGQSLTGTYLAQAVAAITGAGGDGTRVVRVGTQYTTTSAVGSGTEGTYALYSGSTAIQANDYITIKESGLDSTVNAKVQSVGSGTIVLVSAGAEAVPLADTYTAAAVARSTTAASANQAEAILTAPVYGAPLGVTSVVGNKNAYTFTCTNSALIAAGDVLKITQSGKVPTREVQVASVDSLTGTVSLITTTNTASGRQALPLQDNYTDAAVAVCSSQTGQVGMHLVAATHGTWANTSGSAVGLTLTVSPGTAPDTKKFLVYLNGALVETLDNLSFTSGDAYYFTTALAGSTNVNVLAVLGTEPPGNTLNPWNLALYTASNVGTFAGGADGANVAAADYVGALVSDETATGLEIFNDNETYGGLYAVAAPGVTDMAVVQQLARVAAAINAFAPVDVPDSINGREAVDYTNAQGLYANLSRLDNYRVGFFWNWFKTLNPFTGLEEFVPPTVGVLAAMSLTFDRYAPWYAAAGDQRGQLPNATAVRYPRVRDAVKEAMQGNGNVLNPILLYRGTSIEIYGDLTSQRTTSKLQAIHTVHLVNYLVKNMGTIARKYVFDPNDTVLYQQLTLEFTSLLEGVRTQRGLEAYELACDSSNNTATTRNARNVIVDLAIIPTDVAERIYINVTVNASGAVLNAVTNGVSI